MSASTIIYVTWDGRSFNPVNQTWANRISKEFAIGEHYQMALHEQRSAATHNHYFAVINEAFINLPENQASRFATPEHLRHWALITAGYHDERSIVCALKAEALRVAAFIRPMDDYAVVTVSAAVVCVFTAKSQSMRAMGKDAFQDSKTKVLDIIAELIGVSPDTLSSNAGQAA